MDSSDHQLSSDDMEKMFGRLDDAWRTSQWQDALTTADKLMDMVGRDGCGGVVAFKRLKAAALHALQSFSDALEGSRSTASSEMTGAPVPLATAFTALCGVFSQLLQQRGASLADALLADCSFASALLRAAATVPSRLPDFNGSAAKSKADAFAMLQVRRSAGDLLANLLDDASAALRSQRERELLMDSSEPAATLLVEALVLSSPDPKLHGVLLELLWRGLRRTRAADNQSAVKPAAVQRLESLVGLSVCQKLCDVTGDQLLDWAQELALDLNKSSAGVVALTECSLKWGKLKMSKCAVNFSMYGLEVSGMCSSGGQEEECTFEAPWTCVQRPDLVVERPLPYFFCCDAASLQNYGVLQPNIMAMISVEPDAILELHCALSAEEVASVGASVHSLICGDKVSVNAPDHSRNANDDARPKAKTQAKPKPAETTHVQISEPVKEPPLPGKKIATPMREFSPVLIEAPDDVLSSQLTCSGWQEEKQLVAKPAISNRPLKKAYGAGSPWEVKTEVPPAVKGKAKAKTKRHTPPSQGHTPPSPGHTPPSLGHTPPSLGHTPPSLGHTPTSHTPPSRGPLTVDAEPVPMFMDSNVVEELGDIFTAHMTDTTPLKKRPAAQIIAGMPPSTKVSSAKPKSLDIEGAKAAEAVSSPTKKETNAAKKRQSICGTKAESSPSAKADAKAKKKDGSSRCGADKVHDSIDEASCRTSARGCSITSKGKRCGKSERESVIPYKGKGCGSRERGIHGGHERAGRDTHKDCNQKVVTWQR